jgi:BirA family biotin operon repressor/biotin-[acetyl-CoA-carboxylase] ligase
MKASVSSSPHQYSILLEMMRSRGYVPHSEMMGRLGLERNELCDILLELSGNGFVLDAHPHAGVRLLNEPEPLTPQLIADRMSTEMFARNVHHSFAVESTNSAAIELTMKGNPEGTLVVTEYQWRGRGRFGRRWQSPPFSSILATLVLRPLPASFTPIVVLAAASRIAESLRRIGVDAHIRWPNDIVVAGKKICGILAESRAGYTVCGFGLNVNQDSFTSSLATSATSVRKELGRFHSRLGLLRSILQEFEENYERLLNGETSELAERTRERLGIPSRPVGLLSRDDVLTGQISDIGETGPLILRQRRGDTLSILPDETYWLVGQSEPDSRL